MDLTQIGGNYEWFGVTDRFYRTELPDTWYSRYADGSVWRAYRDVDAAGLTDVGSGSSIPKQTFAIVEPSFNELRENGSRNGSGMKWFFKYNLIYPKN